MQLLAAEGYKRIALIALEEAGHDSQPFIKAYKRAVEDCGLKYEAMEFCNNSVVASMAGTRRLLDRKNPPDAIYVADDFVFYGVAEALAVSNVKPGVDLGVITLSNRGHQLPPGNDWSRLELDPHLFGHIAVDSLLRIIQTAGTEAGNIGVYASWRPGQTHKRPV
ncbi:MAG TPA: substrate-binding domain-containing protein [Tepidisphaeraceae bacterium]|nr:substrate-binding domain-containing protein [Tepidisphaeraceae bacterium]